eukprot:TRINITY_DN19349_c0_g1_i1.p1 TRINITY_DN19349_c0_g1~~TRINITY_DN19349_c0_g1_i1.p1  ORF type:complete len:270 (+),score=51.31 TRINITY_DN19349_c0_g1_i1:100-909(+)
MTNPQELESQEQNLMSSENPDELLEFSRPYYQTTAGRKVIVIGLGVSALVGIAMATALRPKALAAEVTSIIGAFDDHCWWTDVYYGNPVKLEGSERTVQPTAQACQEVCRKTKDCGFFSFWPDGGCMLAPVTSVPLDAPKGYNGVVSGASSCDATQARVVQPPPAVATLVDPFEVTKEHQNHASISRTPGPFGRLCTAYAKCVAEGDVSGYCCPNDRYLMLGCCQVEEATPAPVAKGGDCSASPGCAAANLTGQCCPTATGVRLGCCDA